MNKTQQPRPRAEPAPTAIDPLRQLGVGPVFLAVYMLGLVALQFFLVSLGTKPFLRSC